MIGEKRKKHLVEKSFSVFGGIPLTPFTPQLFLQNVFFALMKNLYCIISRFVHNLLQIFFFNNGL